MNEFDVIKTIYHVVRSESEFEQASILLKFKDFVQIGDKSGIDYPAIIRIDYESNTWDIIRDIAVSLDRSSLDTAIRSLDLLHTI